MKLDSYISRKYQYFMFLLDYNINLQSKVSQKNSNTLVLWFILHEETMLTLLPLAKCQYNIVMYAN